MKLDIVVIWQVCHKILIIENSKVVQYSDPSTYLGGFMQLKTACLSVLRTYSKKFSFSIMQIVKLTCDDVVSKEYRFCFH